MSEEPKKKRQYSRNGCRDCKKRKLKCDEARPACRQCAASKRTCIYEKVIKFNNSRIVTINSKGERETVKIEEDASPIAGGVDGQFVPKKRKTVNSPSQNLNHMQQPLMMTDSGFKSGHFPLRNDTNVPFFDARQNPELYNELLNDASSLISDLNELINSDSPFYFPESMSDASLTNDFGLEDDFFIQDPVIPKITSNQNLDDFKILNVLENSLTQADLVNISNFFQLSISSSHISYLKTFVTKVHINLMPFSTLYLHNAFINNILIQAKKSQYLLSAILLISARYEYYQLFNNKGQKNDNLKIHGKLRSYYLSSCLNSLDSILEKKDVIVNNIESLLFTTLILACDFSSSTGSNWRAHLRGAKDLLLKYSSYTSMNNVSLLISKTIFSSMEMLAALTVSIGGTIHSSKELNQLLNLHDADYGKYLNYYGLSLDAKYCDDDIGTEEIVPHSYNIYFGHSNEVTLALKEIILCLEAIRRAKAETKHLTLDDFLEDSKFQSMIQFIDKRPQLCAQQTLKVFALLHKASNVYVITKKSPFLIPTDSPYHPLNAKSLLLGDPIVDKIPVSCYFLNEWNGNWYSWYDLCNQSYVDAAMLRFLLLDKIFAMKSSSSTAQLLIKKIISSLFFLEIKEYSKEDEVKLIEYYGSLDDNDKDMIHSMTAEKQNSEYNNNNNTNNNSEAQSDVDDDPPRLEIVNNSEISSPTSVTPTPPPVVPNNKKLKRHIKEKLQISKYLKTQFDHRIIMIQWPLLICGICAYRAIDKLIIETCFDQMISYGIGSAEISLNKIKKNWLLHGISYGDKISDNLFWDDGDSVPFS